MYGVAIVAALMAIVGSILMITLGRIARVDPVQVIAILVLAVFAGWFMPRLRIGGSRHGQSLTDFTIIFGLTLLPGPWLILTIAVATVIGKKAARFPAGRIVFNTAKDVITVFVAATAGWLCELGSPFETTATNFGRIVIVALIALATDEAISVPVIALANAQRARDVWAAYAPFRLVMAMIRMGCGIAAGYLVNPDPRMALALPVLAIALHLAYANRLQQRVDRLAWARLSQLVDAVSTGEPQTVRLAAVHGTAELFACAEVDLVLRTRSKTDVMLRGDSRIITYVGPAASAPERGGTVIVAPLGPTDPRTMPPPDGDSVGELRLRFLAPVEFTEQERHTLQALAAALATAVRKSVAVSAAERMATTQARAATHDRLTGLANRSYLLAHGLAEVGRQVVAASGSDDTTEPGNAHTVPTQRDGVDPVDRADAHQAASDPATPDPATSESVTSESGRSDSGTSDPATWDPADPIEPSSRVQRAGLAVIDLIGFKQINDALGQIVGDQVLISVGERLADLAGPSELVARVSGGEFAVLLTSIDSTADAIARTRDLLAAIAKPLTVDGVRLDIAATAGVAVNIVDGDLGELLRRADVAAQQAKLDGLAVSAYAPTRDTADVGRLALGADLTRAVAHREFTIAFQPIVDLATGDDAVGRGAGPLAAPAPRPTCRRTGSSTAIERSGLLPAFTEQVLDQALAGARALAGRRLRRAGRGQRLAAQPARPGLPAPRSRAPWPPTTCRPSALIDRADRDADAQPARGRRRRAARAARSRRHAGAGRLRHRLLVAGDDRPRAGRRAEDRPDVRCRHGRHHRGRDRPVHHRARPQPRTSWWSPRASRATSSASGCGALGCPAGQGHLFGRPMSLDAFIGVDAGPRGRAAAGWSHRFNRAVRRFDSAAVGAQGGLSTV